MYKLVFFLFFVIGIFYFMSEEFVDVSYAQSSKNLIIYPSEDSFVDESEPGENFANDKYLFSGWSHGLPNQDQSIAQILSYIKFPLDKIPQSNAYEIVTIDAIKLNIGIETTWWNENDKHSLTVNPCFDDIWKEESITWNTRPCKENLENGGYYPLEKLKLQDTNQFDITEIIENERIIKLSEITLILSSCSTDELRIDCQNPGLVLIYSLDSQRQNVLPSLSVEYTTTINPVIYYVISIVITTSAISIYFKSRKAKKKQEDKDPYKITNDPDYD